MRQASSTARLDGVEEVMVMMEQALRRRRTETFPKAAPATAQVGAPQTLASLQFPYRNKTKHQMHNPQKLQCLLSYSQPLRIRCTKAQTKALQRASNAALRKLGSSTRMEALWLNRSPGNHRRGS
jgi:hypothetical protein